MRTARGWGWLAVGLAAWVVAGCGSKAKAPPSPQAQGPDAGGKVDAGGEAKAADAGADAGVVGGVPGWKLPQGVDPKALCGEAALDPAKIPPMPVVGELARNKEEALGLRFNLAAGSARVELQEERASLRLSSEPLKACSPFLADGGLAKEPRLSVVLAALERKTYSYPNEPAAVGAPVGADAGADAGAGAAPVDGPPQEAAAAFKYWSYVYNTEQSTPFTMNSFSSQDRGVVVIDEIDEGAQVVRGRLLLCKGKGEGGWALGNFEATVCDKRPPKPPQVEEPGKGEQKGAAPEKIRKDPGGKGLPQPKRP